MEKFYFSKEYFIYSCINMVGGLLSGAVCAIVGTLTIKSNLLGSWVLFALSFFMIAHTILFVIFLNRKYAVSDRGIAVQYANRYTIFYPWEKIQLVCLGITHRSGTGTTQDTVIWCTTKLTGYLPPTKVHRHTSWEYDYLHYRSIITIEFTEERYAQFASYYQQNITDYR